MTTIPQLPVLARTPCRCWDIKKAALWFVWNTSESYPFMWGPKKPVYSRTQDPKGFIMALTCRNELRLLHFSFCVKAHFLYHLWASLTREGLPVTCQVVGPGQNVLCDFQFSFVYTKDWEERTGKVKVNEPFTPFCWLHWLDYCSSVTRNISFNKCLNGIPVYSGIWKCSKSLLH